MTDTATTPTAAKKTYARQKVDYTTEQIGPHVGALPSDWLDVLYGAANGWDYADLAERLNLPLGTVKSRLNRARARLAKLIEADKAAAVETTPLGSG